MFQLKKKLLFISIFIICILAIGSVSASEVLSDSEDGADSADLVLTDVHSDSANVLRDGDLDNGDLLINENPNTVTPGGNTFEDIQESINNASDNDIILLDGVYTGSGAEIKVNKTLTIMSQSQSTLDAKASSRIFNITAPDVVIIGLNFINGMSPEGGAIHSTNSLEIYNSSFNDNRANRIRVCLDEDGNKYNLQTGFGGAIFSNSTLIVENSSFTNNSAYVDKMRGGTCGGAIYSGNVRMAEYSDLVEEKPEYYIEWPSDGGNLIVIGCNFTENQNPIAFFGNLALDSSKFIKNYKQALYCEVYKSHPGISITSCDFINNTASNAKEYDYCLLECRYENIFNSLFMDCNFINNRYYYSTVLTGMNSTFANTKFIGNIAKVGGAISAGDNLTVIDSYFANNAVVNEGEYGEISYGGAISAVGRMHIHNSTFENNSAEFGAAIYSSDCFYDYYDEDDEYHYEYIDSNVTITNSTFKNNIEGAVLLRRNCEITIDGSKIKSKTQIALNNDLKSAAFVKLVASDFTVSFNSSKKMTVKLLYADSNKPVANFLICLKVKNNGKTLSYNARTNDKGIATFSRLSLLTVGTHTLAFTSNGEVFEFPKKTVKAKVIKASTTVRAPKVTSKYKKSKYFKATVKIKANKKLLKGVKVKIKVYTGKKYKTYTVKTNTKGIAQINTKGLKKGKHKVVISSANSNYIISKTSYIVIK